MATNFLLSALLGYLLGSIPMAFLLVRWKARKDIRYAGSGNVGALNSYLVTRSRLVGVAVLGLDMLKGIAAVAASWFLLNGGLAECAVAGLASVVGHNYSVWLKLKGGRGLATAAGVALMLAWPIIPAWMLLWGLGFALTRNVNVGNTIATLLLIILAVVVPSWIVERVIGTAMAAESVRLAIISMFGVILLKHIAPARDFVRTRREATRPDRSIGRAEKESS